MGSLLQSQALRYVSATIDSGEFHHTVVICKTLVSFVVHQNLIGSVVMEWPIGRLELSNYSINVFQFFKFQLPIIELISQPLLIHFVLYISLYRSFTMLEMPSTPDLPSHPTSVDQLRLCPWQVHQL